MYYSAYKNAGAGQTTDEEATGEGTKGDDEGKTSGEGPKTGDDFNMAAMIAIMESLLLRQQELRYMAEEERATEDKSRYMN